MYKTLPASAVSATFAPSLAKPPVVGGRVTKSGVVHRKKCRHPKTAADLLRRYCLVCGAKAENYNFGVISCESCKAFFRRNAHKQTLGEAGYACSFRLGRCDVNLASRKKCPGCRLAKCFAVGMQAELIQRADMPPLSQDQQQKDAELLLCGISSQKLQRQHQEVDQRPSLGHHCSQQLVRLWQHLHAPASVAACCQPSVFTNPDCCGVSESRDCANILLVDFFNELRALVRDTVLCDIPVAGGGTDGSELATLRAFVQQAGKFAAGLRQADGLERPHLLALLRCRLHAILFPLSCAGYSPADGGFYFSLAGRRVRCQPIELFCDLVRRPSSRLVDATPLADVATYTQHLLDATEMRPELLALFCAVKLFCLPPPPPPPITVPTPASPSSSGVSSADSSSGDSSGCGGADDGGGLDDRLRGACARLALRYHQHLVDSLYYHYPFDFEAKLAACCRLFKWSLPFDRALESFFQYCPLGCSDD